MKDLTERLRITASMIEFGERIAWGSDSALMREAADALDALGSTEADGTPDERYDAALEAVLRAAGSSLKYYTLPSTLEAMRKAMRKVMSDSYIQGSNDCHKAKMRKTR